MIIIEQAERGFTAQSRPEAGTYPAIGAIISYHARQWLSTQDVRSIFHRLQTANKSKKNDEKGRGRGRPKMAVPPCEGDEDEDCEGEVDASEDVYNMLDSVNGYGSDDDSDDDDQAGPSTSGH